MKWNWFCESFHNVRYGEIFHIRVKIGDQCKHYPQREDEIAFVNAHYITCCRDFITKPSGGCDLM